MEKYCWDSSKDERVQDTGEHCHFNKVCSYFKDERNSRGDRVRFAMEKNVMSLKKHIHKKRKQAGILVHVFLLYFLKENFA